MNAVRQRATTVATFVVERYWPGVTTESFTEADRRVHDATRAPRDDEAAIRIVASTLVPEDEAVYWVVDAPSADIVRAAWARAEVPVERIVQALDVRASRDPLGMELDARSRPGGRAMRGRS